MFLSHPAFQLRRLAWVLPQGSFQAGGQWCVQDSGRPWSSRCGHIYRQWRVVHCQWFHVAELRIRSTTRQYIYEEFIYICTVHVELRNKPHIVHHAPSKDENTVNTRQVSDYAHQQRNSKHLTQHVSRLLYSSQQA